MSSLQPSCPHFNPHILTSTLVTSLLPSCLHFNPCVLISPLMSSLQPSCPHFNLCPHFNPCVLTSTLMPDLFLPTPTSTSRGSIQTSCKYYTKTIHSYVSITLSCQVLLAECSEAMWSEQNCPSKMPERRFKHWSF